MNRIYSIVLAQESVPTVTQPSIGDPGFILYKIPQTPFTIFVLFLLPIAMVIIHVIFTLKYWKSSKNIFKVLTSLAFVPLIFLSWISINYSFIYHRLLYEVLTLYYLVWPFYTLLVLFWVIKYFKQKRAGIWEMANKC